MGRSPGRIAAFLSVAMAAVACGGPIPAGSSIPTTSATSTIRTTTTTTTVAVSTTLPPSDRWRIEIVDWEDDFDDVDRSLAWLLDADAVIEATIVSLGAADGRWCCENPPIEVTDLTVVGGEPPRDDGRLNGVSFQSLDRSLEPGDRVTLLVQHGVALVVFTEDGSVAHPVPPSIARAIDAAVYRYAASSGRDPSEVRREVSPLEVLGGIWEQYHDDWWGMPEQRAALALSGFEGRPVTCSAADLAGLLGAWPSYPPAGRDLPSAVLATRAAIIEAATGCDYERIIELAGYRASTEEQPVDVDVFWWNAMRDLDVFVQGDLTVGYLREVVLALTQTAVGAGVGSFLDPETGEHVETTAYVWPAAAVLDLSDPAGDPRSFVELVGDEEELARIASLNDTTVENLVGAVEDFGGYAWFRTGIAEGGRWLFALSGD